MTAARAILGWLVLLAVAFLNGTVRQLAFPSWLGDFEARQVAVGTGAVALGLAMWALLRRWPPRDAVQAWGVGALWAALTLVFEAAMTRATGHPWAEVAEQYAIWKGSLWALLLLWILVAPAAISRLQRSAVAVGTTVRWAIACWMACGATFGLARSALGVDAAIWIHLVAAPVIGAVATFLLWDDPRHPGIVGTAATIAGTAALLDAIVVAPFLEQSYAMFGSLAGTWIPLLFIFAASAATATLLARPAGRSRFLAWTATREEQLERLPGDELLDASSPATHAITVAAPPAEVWPWLVQMGYGRAGWYSHDRLDNGGQASAATILPDLQPIAVGDLIPSSKGGRTFFEVMDVRPACHLVLGFHLAWPMRDLRWSEPSTRVSQRATWAFALRPSGDGGTRLLVRARGRSRPAWLWLPWDAFFHLAHLPMQRKQLLGIRRRAERRRVDQSAPNEIETDPRKAMGTRPHSGGPP
jgi:proline iminopeptidase